MITIGSNWDGGTYFFPEYVNRLYRACRRNTTIPFEFVLYVGPKAEEPGRCDGIDRDVRIVPVGLPSWWSGMPFWMAKPPGIRTDSILYLDLDVVITGSLDDLIRYPSSHACMKDYPSFACPKGREKDGNVSVTLIRNGAGSIVWEKYLEAGKPIWNPLGTVKGPLPLAAQELVNRYVKTDLFPEDWVCSYKLHVLKKGVPSDCRAVAFHGRPKPHEVKDSFVKENWT